MNKDKLEEKINLIKKQLSDSNNKNNHIERKKKLDELNEIKNNLKQIEINKRCGLNEYIPNNPNEFNEHIDNYRYFSLYNKLNLQYIKCNCKFNIGDIVKSSCGKIGQIANIKVYPELVTREQKGIYVILNSLKSDGTKLQRTIRKSALDTKGFPIEEILYYNKT